MAFQSLFLSRDEEALSLLQAVLDELRFESEICVELEPALDLLADRKFDLVVVDCDDFQNGTDILLSIRLTHSSKKAIVLAMVNGTTSMQAAFDMGANFVVSKPLSLEAVMRTLRAARGLVLRLGRRSLRLAVPALAYVSFDGRRDQAIILDISEGGMAVQALDAVEASRAINVRFELPGNPDAIEATGEIAWADVSGRAGIRFVEISEDGHRQLKDWLLMNAMGGSWERNSTTVGHEPGPADFMRGAGGLAMSRAARASINLGGNGNLGARPDYALPYVAEDQAASQRVFAAFVDGAMVLLGNVLFGVIVVIFSKTLPQSRLALPVGLLVPCFFWTVYHAVFVAYPGGTPGMQVAERRQSLPRCGQILSWLENHGIRARAALPRAPRARLSPITIAPPSAVRQTTSAPAS